MRTTSATSTATRRSQRLVSWDAIRVLAIVSVVLDHSTHEASILLPQLAPMPFLWPMQVGASTMLLVSAYFVCVTVGRGSPGRWWWNRVARLLPPYLVAVVLTFAVLTLVPLPGLFHPTLHALWGNLLLRETADPTVGFMDPSYWTLPVQLFAFTVAALLIRRLPWGGRRPTAFAWALIVLPLAIKPFRLDWEPFRAFYDGVGMHRWQLFGMGIAIWLWTQKRLSFGHLVLVLMAGVVAQYGQNFGQDYNLAESIVLAVITGLVCLSATGAEWLGPLTRPLARPITWLAGISYGVYLLHQQLGYVVALELQGAGVTGWPRLLLVLAAGVALGWAMTRLVEKPVHRYLAGSFPDQLAGIAHAARVRAVTATVTLRIARLQTARLLAPGRREARIEPAPQVAPVAALPPNAIPSPSGGMDDGRDARIDDLASLVRADSAAGRP